MSEYLNKNTMGLIQTIWFRIRSKWMVRHAVVEVTHSWATVAQLVHEYDSLDPEEQKKMLEWAKDPKNPNPNAIFFYRNIQRLG